MKSNFNPTPKGWTEQGQSVLRRMIILALGMAGMGWVVLAGCTNRTPFDSGYPGLTPTPNVTPVYPAPTTVPNKNLVANFDNNSAFINPNLMEINNPPNYVLKTAGSVTAINNFPANITGFSGTVVGGGVSGYCFRVQGMLTDPGNASYPAAELEAMMEGGNLYDGSFFSGVKFYLWIGPDDNALKRDFSIPVFQTQGTPQGGCVGGNAGGCYDNFGVLLTGSAGQWGAYNVPFSSLTQAYAGVVTTPNPNFAGQNLQQMLWLQWEEGRNNTAGTSTLDYAVDDIEFY